MSWKELLDRGSLARHRTSQQELSSWRSMVRRDLDDASLVGLSSDRSFGIAYGAVLILAKMVIASAGYRVKGEDAHRVAFEALELAMRSEVEKLKAYFDVCRRKRNQLSYDVAGGVSEAEAQELREEAEVFRRHVEAWIRQHHPHLRE